MNDILTMVAAVLFGTGSFTLAEPLDGDRGRNRVSARKISSVWSLTIAAGMSFHGTSVLALEVRPELSGVLKEYGKVLADVQVLVGTSSDINRPCQGATAVGSTNAKGEFYVARKKEGRTPAPNESPPVLQLTIICFDVRGQTILGTAVMSSALKEQSYRMSCDIAAVDASFKSLGQLIGMPAGVCSNLAEAAQ